MDVTSSRLIFLADTKVCPEPLVQSCCRPGQGYSGPSRPGRAGRVKLPPPATSASSPARWLAPCRRRLVSSSSWFMATLGTVPWWILFSREQMCSYSVHPERTALLPPPGAAGTCPCGAQTARHTVHQVHDAWGWVFGAARGWWYRDAGGAGVSTVQGQQPRSAGTLLWPHRAHKVMEGSQQGEGKPPFLHLPRPGGPKGRVAGAWGVWVFPSPA